MSNSAFAQNLIWEGINNVSAGGQDIYDIHVTLSSDGTRAGAVSRRYDGAKYFVQSAFASIEGNSADWSAAQDLSRSGQSGQKPQIAISSDGTRAIAVWIDYVFGPLASYHPIHSRSAVLTRNMATWGATKRVSPIGQNAVNLQVAVSSDGGQATAVWRLVDGSNIIVQSSSALVTGNMATWQVVHNLSATDEEAEYPEIALSSDGSMATATWRRNAASDDIVQSASGYVVPVSCFLIKSSNDKIISFCL